MTKTFSYEIIIGAIVIACVSLFGVVGFASISLFAFSFLWSKRNLDEREYQLFYRVGNLTAGLTVVYMTSIYILRTTWPSIDQTWLGLCIGGTYLAHGCSGLFVFSRY